MPASTYGSSLLRIYIFFLSISKLIFVYVSLSEVVQDITYLRRKVFFFFFFLEYFDEPARWFVNFYGYITGTGQRSGL